MKVLRLLVITLLSGLLTTPVFSDTIRGPVVGFVQPVSQKMTKLKAGELLIIEKDESAMRRAAVKIDVAIPQSVRKVRGAYALYLYTDISPPPSLEDRRYRGDAIEFLIIPTSSLLTVYLPLSSDFETQNS